MLTFSSSQVFLFIVYALSNINQGNSFEAFVALRNTYYPNALTLPLTAKLMRGQPASYPKLEDTYVMKYVYLCPYSTPHDQHLIESIMDSKDKKFDYLRCLFETSPPIEEEHSMCSMEVLPLLTQTPTTDQSNTNTKKSKHLGTLSYDFGFYYCGWEGYRDSRESMLHSPVSVLNTQLLKIYSIRFDHSKSRTLWTMHTIQTDTLYHTRMQESSVEIIENPMSTEDFDLPKNTFSSISDTYTKQLQASKKYKMIAQLMVPAEDVALQLWQKTIFHYANTNPLWERLMPLMKTINDGIRKAAIVVDKEDNFQQRHFIIHTATYSPYRLAKFGKSIVDDFGWNIWCKFVLNRKKNQGVMIYLHSIPDSPPRKIPTPDGKVSEVQEKFHVEKECQVILPCDFETWSDAQQNELKDILPYAYCCPPNKEKIKQLFDKDITEELDILEMDDFIKQFR